MIPVNMMKNSTETTGESVDLAITRREADLIHEALNVLCNCRRYSFKDEHKRITELYRDLFEDVGRIRNRLRNAFPTE